MPLPERELIAKIRRAAGSTGRSLVRGIGDDCAVLRLPAGHEALVTTDFSLEGVHFRREWFPPESVGHRCLTRGLSDIAAMGGEPQAAFLSLALPPELPQEWVDGFLRGFIRLARRFKVQLAGGDTAQSPVAQAATAQAPSPAQAQPRAAVPQDPTPVTHGSVLADIMVLGSVPRGKAVLRSGAEKGDDIYVTGDLGSPLAALNRLMSGTKATGLKPAASRKLFSPTPRVEVGRWLRERGLVSAMIDISDGLSTDLSHICEESGAGAWIAEAAVPVARGATLEDALHGGDEYELLFTASAAKHDRIPDRIAGVPIRWLGTVTKKRGLWLVAADMKSRRELEVSGWEHFVNP